MKIIGHVYTDFSTKFGVPRQSGLAGTGGRIVLKPEFAKPDAVRGLEQFSHIWLLWKFSEIPEQTGFRATVRPPRLGGDTRVGVFATRSPFRPNPIGLSCVRLDRIEYDAQKGPILYVTGVDLVDGTPLYDIKPYLPYVDSHPEASEGFTEESRKHVLKVEIPKQFQEQLEPARVRAVREVLALDPRPSYQEDPQRIYGMEYAGWDIRFCVQDSLLRVVEMVPCGRNTGKKPEIQ